MRTSTLRKTREDIIDITHDGPWAAVRICPNTNQHLDVNAPVRSAVIEDPQKLLPDDADPPYELAMMDHVVNGRTKWNRRRKGQRRRDVDMILGLCILSQYGFDMC